jgi:signal peptidase II
MKRKNIIFWIVCLVIADQGVKLIIANYFIDTRFDIIDSILGFRPVFNGQYTYFNALLKLNIGLLPHTVLLIFLQLAILFFYKFARIVQHSTKLLDISFIFGQSAFICVFCGFFLWEAGVLDFLYLRLWTVDFKDIYLNCFVILFLLNYHKNKTMLKSSKIKLRDCLLNEWGTVKQLIKKR